MALKLQFTSGLPRSGSTLLAAILRQNPRFQASVESPVANMCSTLARSMSGAYEAAMFISDNQRRQIFRALVDAYYCDFGARTIFDNSRLWCNLLPMLGQIFPQSKVVCCVRNVAWILDSMERLVQENSLCPSRMFRHDPGMDVYSRVASLMDTGCVGSALRGLRQAWFGEHASRIVAIRYEALVADPESVIRRLYDLIEEDYFPHRFNNIEYEEAEFDRFIGLPGMHTVRQRVAVQTRQSVLPPDLFEHHNQEFWNLTQENPRGVLVL